MGRIGGVLEPASASPVIIEDGAFLGSRSIIVEGVRIEREAVLGAGVVITPSTPIIDVVVLKKRSAVAAYRRVVLSYQVAHEVISAGEYGLLCALIIGQRKESTDRKTVSTTRCATFLFPSKRRLLASLWLFRGSRPQCSSPFFPAQSVREHSSTFGGKTAGHNELQCRLNIEVEWAHRSAGRYTNPPI